MTRLVKVGDKVKSKVYGHGVIEDDGVELVGARFDSGSYRAYRKDDWSSTLEDDSIEFIQPIKVGDTVTLIDRPWETDVWKGMGRVLKKCLIRDKDFGWTVKGIVTASDGTAYATLFTELLNGWKNIYSSCPLDLLRKVGDGINAEWITTGVAEPKKGDLFRVIGNDGHHMHSVGDVVEFLEVASELSYETYCPKTGRTQFVHKTDLKPYDGINRHTPEQVAEAQRIIGEIVASLPDWDTFFFRRVGSETMLYVGGNANKQNSAKCRETDEYNQTIGRMIALCKATGRKLPDWI